MESELELEERWRSRLMKERDELRELVRRAVSIIGSIGWAQDMEAEDEAEGFLKDADEALRGKVTDGNV